MVVVVVVAFLFALSPPPLFSFIANPFLRPLRGRFPSPSSFPHRGTIIFLSPLSPEHPTIITTTAAAAAAATTITSLAPLPGSISNGQLHNRLSGPPSLFLSLSVSAFLFLYPPPPPPPPCTSPHARRQVHMPQLAAHLCTTCSSRMDQERIKDGSRMTVPSSPTGGLDLPPTLSSSATDSLVHKSILAVDLDFIISILFRARSSRTGRPHGVKGLLTSQQPSYACSSSTSFFSFIITTISINRSAIHPTLLLRFLYHLALGIDGKVLLTWDQRPLYLSRRSSTLGTVWMPTLVHGHGQH